MSALLMMTVCLIALLAGYRLYGFRVSTWLRINEQEQTPATTLNDGVDYVPAKHWLILFGHHFASIAGAAPIIGPVIACLYWGWLPAILWILIGGIFMGAVHDFCALVLSLRNKGMSIATITETILGKQGKIVFSFFVFLALILVVAVFAAVAGKTLATTPQVVIPTFGLIVVAILIGFLMYRIGLSVLLCSGLGIAMLFGLIWLGYEFPIELPVQHAESWWTIILLIYGLIASVTPITILLQPRDHLAASVLFTGMGLGFLGLAVTRPEIQAPAVHAVTGEKGPIWPMLFVIIACGAISGFHSLVASGTTSKQCAHMKDARIIGYGGMIMESALSILAVIAVTAGLFWKSAPAGMSGPVYQVVFQEGGWIKAFGTGYGEITRKLLGGFGMVIGITMLKTFVMTTLDSATRITRYISVELFGETLSLKPFKNKYVSTACIGLLAGALALGNWKAIWPLFGASNQLIASMVLIVTSLVLLRSGTRFLFTLLPALFMLVTTMGAMAYKTVDFLSGPSPKPLLGILSIAIMGMAIFLLYQSICSVHQKAVSLQSSHDSAQSEKPE